MADWVIVLVDGVNLKVLCSGSYTEALPESPYVMDKLRTFCEQYGTKNIALLETIKIDYKITCEPKEGQGE